MSESIQHKLDRVRPPRVQITYDVEIGDAIEKKELAFVLGIMADLSGVRETILPTIRLRKFVEIDRDNFNDVLKSIRPHLRLVVANKMSGKENDTIAIDLHFENIDDFEPIAIVKQASDIKKLYDSRNKLKDLITRMDGNDELEELLTQIIADKSKRDALKQAGSAKPQEGGK